MAGIVFVCHPRDLEAEAGRILEFLRARFGSDSLTVVSAADATTPVADLSGVVVVLALAMHGREAEDNATSSEPMTLIAAGARTHAIPVVVVCCEGVTAAGVPDAIAAAASAVIAFEGNADTEAARIRLIEAIEVARARYDELMASHPHSDATPSATAELRAPSQAAETTAASRTGALSLRDLESARNSVVAVSNTDLSNAESDESILPPTPSVAGPVSAELGTERYSVRRLAYGPIAAVLAIFGGATFYFITRQAERAPRDEQLDVIKQRPQRQIAIEPRREATAPPPSSGPSPTPLPTQRPPDPPARQPLPPPPMGGPPENIPASFADVGPWRCAEPGQDICRLYRHEGGRLAAVPPDMTFALPMPALAESVELRAVLRNVGPPLSGTGVEAGLLFWADGATPEQAHAALILEKTFEIVSVTPAGSTRIASGPTEGVISTSGAPIDLKLVLAAGKGTFSINGRIVSEFAATFPAANSYFGWFVSADPRTPAAWEFRDVHARPLPPRTSTPALRPRADTVDVSAFAPATGEAGRDVLVQVYLHKPRQHARAAAFAQAADPEAARRSVATLATDIEVGQRVEMRLDAPGLAVDDPIQIITWRGDPCACQFLVRFPPNAAGTNFLLTVRLFVEGVPVGKLIFSLKGAAASMPQERIMQIQGRIAHRYRRAFLSYASQDRVEVLNSVKYLKAAGIDVFQDILSLGPGEQWGPRIYAEIDQCDLFLLFWSSHAAKSEWVLRETEYALNRRRASQGELPDITPFILEGPPVPPPPLALNEIHFNDPIRYVIVAEQHARGSD